MRFGKFALVLATLRIVLCSGVVNGNGAGWTTSLTQGALKQNRRVAFDFAKNFEENWKKLPKDSCVE